MIYPINHLPQTIPVGVQTEKGVEVIGFDLKPWLDVFPDMQFTVWPTRPGEDEAYPAGHQEMSGTVLYWYPDGYDTEIAGTGRVEIAGVDNEHRKASGFVDTSVRSTSLAKTKEPGESIRPWYEAVLQAAKDIKADVDVGKGGLYLVRDMPAGGTDRTVAEIIAAEKAGKTILYVGRDGRVWNYAGMMPYGSRQDYDGDAPTFIAPMKREGSGFIYERVQVNPANGKVHTFITAKAKTPNPYKLTIGGKAYDGSNELIVLPAPSDASSAAYLRWNGTEYVPVTIAQLKADLGLN